MVICPIRPGSSNLSIPVIPVGSEFRASASHKGSEHCDATSMLSFSCLARYTSSSSADAARAQPELHYISNADRCPRPGDLRHTERIRSITFTAPEQLHFPTFSHLVRTMHNVLDRLATATHSSILYRSLAASTKYVSSSPAFLLFPFVLLVFWYTAHAVYNLYFSPLSSIPGPKIAAFSDLWLIFHGALQFRQCKVIHELFETYGPVVRIGPGKVAFKDLGAGKVVYGGSIGGSGGARFEKSGWYKSLMTFVWWFLI